MAAPWHRDAADALRALSVADGEFAAVAEDGDGVAAADYDVAAAAVDDGDAVVAASASYAVMFADRTVTDDRHLVPTSCHVNASDVENASAAKDRAVHVQHLRQMDTPFSVSPSPVCLQQERYSPL